MGHWTMAAGGSRRGRGVTLSLSPRVVDSEQKLGGRWVSWRSTVGKIHWPQEIRGTQTVLEKWRKEWEREQEQSFIPSLSILFQSSKYSRTLTANLDTETRITSQNLAFGTCILVSRKKWYLMLWVVVAFCQKDEKRYDWLALLPS